MKIQVAFQDDPAGTSENKFTQSLLEKSKSQDYEVQIKLNGKLQQYMLKHGDVVQLDDSLIRTDKKNILQFKVFLPGEREESKQKAVGNIWRGIAFVICAIFLPFAFMRFNNTNVVFTRLTVLPMEDYDFVLELFPTRYRCSFVNSAAKIDPYAFEPVNPSDTDVETAGEAITSYSETPDAPSNETFTTPVSE